MVDDLDDVRAAAEDRCDDLAISLLGRPSSRSRREVRWGSHGKLRLKLSTGRWSDFSTGDWGDVFDLAKRELGCSFTEAVEWVREQLQMPRQTAAYERPQRVQADEDSDEARALRARTLYLNSKPARAYGASYLMGRGLDYPEVVEKQLRVNDVWFEGFVTPERALLMPFRDFATKEVKGVHKIALNAVFEDGKRVKRSAGRILGSAMMLGRPGGTRTEEEGEAGPTVRVPSVLAICEGLETGIGIMMGEPGVPVWCLSGASFMEAFAPIEGVEELIIYADNDANRTGQRAAQACADLWHAENRLVTIAVPDRKGDDFADVYRRA